MWLANWVLRLRWPILIVGLVITAAAGWISRDVEANYSFWTLFVSDDPELIRQRAYVDQWGEDSALVFVALRSEAGDVTTSENLAVLAALEERVGGIDGIEEVTSALTQVTVRGEGDDLIIGPLVDGTPSTQVAAAAFRRAALDNRLIAGTLLSKSGRMAVVAARIEHDLADASDRNPIVEAIEAIAVELCAGTDLRHFVVGIPVAQYVYSSKMIRDLALFTGLSGLLLALILLVMFRSLSGLVLPLGVVSAATLLTVATMVITGEQINMINTAIPTLMLVIGIADGIHLFADYRYSLAAGKSIDDSIRHMFVHLGWACMLTSVTTAVGFASLVVARIATVRNFGIYAAIGIMFAFVANMLVIPVGLSILKPQAGYRASERQDSLMTRTLVALGTWINRRPVLALVLSAVVLAGIGAGALRVHIESRMFEEVSDDDPIVIAHHAVEAELPGVTSYALDITTEPGGVIAPTLLRELAELAALAESHPAVDRALGLPHLLEEMNRAAHGGDPAFAVVPDDPALIAQYLLLAEGEATERLVDDERSRTQIWMRGPEVLTSTWEELRAQLEARIDQMGHGPAGTDGARIVVTGSSSMAFRALGSIVRDVLMSLVGASLIILVIMSLLFRSIRIGLVSMIPNLIPLGVTIGVMGWAGINLRTSTVVIFSISLGLAVDDTIHFMVRYGRERAAGLATNDAIIATFRLAGRPIVYTSILLMGGFWILLLSSFNATRDIGLLGGVTLLSALFADLIVLPALLTLMPTVGARGTRGTRSTTAGQNHPTSPTPVAPL